MHTHENDKITMLQIYYHMGDEMERSGNPSQAQVALGCKPLPHQRPIDTIVSSVSHESATLLSWVIYSNGSNTTPILVRVTYFDW